MTRFPTDDKEIKTAVVNLTNSQATNFYIEVLNKLVHRYEKHFVVNGDNVEKWTRFV